MNSTTEPTSTQQIQTPEKVGTNVSDGSPCEELTDRRHHKRSLVQLQYHIDNISTNGSKYSETVGNTLNDYILSKSNVQSEYRYPPATTVSQDKYSFGGQLQGDKGAFNNNIGIGVGSKPRDDYQSSAGNNYTTATINNGNDSYNPYKGRYINKNDNSNRIENSRQKYVNEDSRRY